jgi:hypothetical protein
VRSSVSGIRNTPNATNEDAIEEKQDGTELSYLVVCICVVSVSAFVSVSATASASASVHVSFCPCLHEQVSAKEAGAEL